jgi:protein TonB
MIHTSSDLYKTSWMELVFKNRNKAYGAYQLRAQSSTITVRSVLIVVPIFIMLFAGPMLYRKFFSAQIEPRLLSTPVEVLTVLPAASKAPPKKEEPPKAELATAKLKTVKLPSRITVTERPEFEETPPSVKDMENAVIAQVTQAGKIMHETAAPPAGNGKGTLPVEDDIVYGTESLEKFPEFEGGMAAWAKFIQHNLRYPEIAVEQGTQGKVFVSFVVEKDGSISDVSVVKGIGSGCDEEALRVIRKSPRWKPGMQQNIPVRVRYNMPLSFILTQ